MLRKIPLGPLVVKFAYCPRCDKPFRSTISRSAAMAKMRAHLVKAHPDFVSMYEEQ